MAGPGEDGILCSRLVRQFSESCVAERLEQYSLKMFMQFQIKGYLPVSEGKSSGDGSAFECRKEGEMDDRFSSRR